jgi:hypothetical protein
MVISVNVAIVEDCPHGVHKKFPQRVISAALAIGRRLRFYPNKPTDGVCDAIWSRPHFICKATHLQGNAKAIDW